MSRTYKTVESQAKRLLSSLLQECTELIAALAAKGWDPRGPDSVQKQYPEGWVRLWAYEHGGQIYVYGVASCDVAGYRKDRGHDVEFEDTVERDVDEIAQGDRSVADFADYIDDEAGSWLPSEDSYEAPEPDYDDLDD